MKPFAKPIIWITISLILATAASSIAQRDLDPGINRILIPNEIVIAYKTDVEDRNIGQTLNALNITGFNDNVNINSVRPLLQWQRPADDKFTNVILVQFEGEAKIEEWAAYLGSQPGIDWAYPNYALVGDVYDLTPNDPSYGSQYHHTLMKNDSAWDITLGDASVIIGITDDGVDIDHEDLVTNIWENTGETPGNGLDDDSNGYIDDVNGWDFVDGNNDPNPNSGGDDHGTHVAGISAARTNNSIGVAGTAGHCTILPLQFYDSGSPWTATMISDAFSYGVDNGAKIINTSYNINGWVGNPVVTAAFQYIHDNGVIHFNSAGNGNQLNPARQAFHQTLLVVSTTSSDTRSGFSNYGTGCDVCAPGSSIFSTILNDAYGTKGGTSMAAPNAAGVAALIWSANPGWTRDQVVAQLLYTCDNIDAANPGFEGLLGAGRVNSYAALTMSLPPPQLTEESGLPNPDTIIQEIPASFSVAFDQVLSTSAANMAGAFKILGAGGDDVFGTGDDVSIDLTWPEYMVGTNDLVLTVTNTTPPAGRYRFIADAAIVENPFGDALDGDGDGAGGDSWYRQFFIGPNVFTPIPPLGSHIGELLDFDGVIEGDTFKVSIEAFRDDRISGELSSSNAGATIHLWYEFNGNRVSPIDVLTGATSALESVTLSSDGIHNVCIAANSGAAIQFDLYRNAVIELIDTGSSPIWMDEYLTLGSGRHAAIGTSSVPFSGVVDTLPTFVQSNAPGKFIDISNSGSQLTIAKDSFAQFFTDVVNPLFDGGLVTVRSNGLVTLDPSFNPGDTNTQMPIPTSRITFMPFWDELGTGNVYHEKRMHNGTEMLIIQWDEFPHSTVGDLTFQVQFLANNDTLIRYLYDDVIVGDPNYDGGASATIGFQFDDMQYESFGYNASVLTNNDCIELISNTILPPLGYSFQSGSNPGYFVDISGSGTSLGLSDDGEATVSTTVGNGLFPAGSITIGNNGGIIAAPGVNFNYTNDPLPSTEFVNALLPFWDDIDSDAGDVYWEERMIDGKNALVVQWDDRPHYNNVGNATFQVQVFESGPLKARYSYPDVDFGDPVYNDGLSATIGYQVNTTEAGMFSHNTATLVGIDYVDIREQSGNRDSLDIDVYLVDLGNNTPNVVDIILTGRAPGSYKNATLVLMDSSRTHILAGGSPRPNGLIADASNYDLAIHDFVADSGAVYAVVVAHHSPGEYSLMVTDSLIFDTENNDANATRELLPNIGMMGHLATGVDSSDRVAIPVTAGDTIRISTTTPFDPSVGLFYTANTLDPKVTLLDSLGNTVATDDNSAPDGKNVQLIHVATTDGPYTILLEPVTGVGSYTLHVQLPDSGCPKNLVLSGTQLISGEYRASESILLKDDITVMPGQMLLLSAPEVTIDPIFDGMLGSEIEVDQTGCQ